MEKAKNLWFLLNKVDRSNLSTHQVLYADKDKYPFFYFLNWNEKLTNEEQKKVALQSLNRSNFKRSIEDAREIVLNLEQSVSENIEEFSQNELIEQFLEKSPVISKLKKQEDDDTSIQIDYAAQKFDYPVSETFAKILIKQEKYTLALEVFEQLSLKFPEKKTYFATLINELNKIITNT